ncbi:MAG TPA: flagellar biosynthetic protein FliO [Polyangia bacterium]|nr:flagellar biosynthetic protein FliO [Polyangia bacterium]
MGLLIGLALASAALLVVLRASARSPSLTAGMRVVGRLPLEPRRSIYLVAVGGRCLVVGVGDGPMALLSELPEVPAEAAAVMAEPVLTRAWRRVVPQRDRA